MRIGIIGFCNLNIMQYLYKYTNILDTNKVNYDVIYWNRLGIKEKTNFSGNAISYNHKVETYQPFRKKIGDFIKYSFFIRNTIIKNKYDRLIVLTTQSAVPITDILIHRYKKKYIFDFRDITKEKKSKSYRKIVNKIISSSYCTMMSSLGFAAELGLKTTNRLLFVHNTQKAEKSERKAKTIKKDKRINICFWGLVRPLKFNEDICAKFGNDDRFSLYYRGVGELEKLREYCQKNDYSNITFSGVYSHDEIPSFANDTDILHCIYENDDEQKNAMPVKAYDAIKYRLPILIMKGSELERFFSGKKCALSVNNTLDDLPNKVYNWYQSLNSSLIDKEYSDLDEKIYRDDLKFQNVLKRFIEKS